MNKIIEEKYEEISKICKKNKVKKLYTFGSINSNAFDETSSDIDLIVELNISDPLKKGETLIHLWEVFETLFKKKVDLITKINVRNPYFRKGIYATKELIYEA